MICRRLRRKTAPRNSPPEQSSSSGTTLQILPETYLLSIAEDIFPEICWCLSDIDVLPVSAAAKPFTVKLLDAGRRLRERPALVQCELSTPRAIWSYLPGFWVAKILRALAPMSVSMTYGIPICVLSLCPPLSARRIHFSLVSLCRSFGRTNDPMWLTFVSFRFKQADIEACLLMQAEAQVTHFSVDVVSLPLSNLKLYMTLEAVHNLKLLDLRLDSNKRHSRRDRGEYAIIARALPHIGTERQVDIRLTQSVFANGANSGESHPHCMSEKCWTHSSLRNCDPLLFFIAIWKADPGYCFNDFLRQHEMV